MESIRGFFFVAHELNLVDVKSKLPKMDLMLCWFIIVSVYPVLYTTYTRWWQLKYFWNFHPELWGRWTQFDEHSFQMGWFNHQPAIYIYIYIWANYNDQTAEVTLNGGE